MPEDAVVAAEAGSADRGVENKLVLWFPPPLAATTTRAVSSDRGSVSNGSSGWACSVGWCTSRGRAGSSGVSGGGSRGAGRVVVVGSGGGDGDGGGGRDHGHLWL